MPPHSGRFIEGEIVVPATLDQVWQAWASGEGAETFFAPRCTVEAWPGGRYEMLFDLDAEPGKQGGEGMKVLAVQPPQMISFTLRRPSKAGKRLC